MQVAVCPEGNEGELAVVNNSMASSSTNGLSLCSPYFNNATDIVLIKSALPISKNRLIYLLFAFKNPNKPVTHNTAAQTAYADALKKINVSSRKTILCSFKYFKISISLIISVLIKQSDRIIEFVTTMPLAPAIQIWQVRIKGKLNLLLHLIVIRLLTQAAFAS